MLQLILVDHSSWEDLSTIFTFHLNDTSLELQQSLSHIKLRTQARPRSKLSTSRPAYHRAVQEHQMSVVK